MTGSEARAVLAAAAALVLAGGTLLAPAAAHAQCVQSGSSVRCTGADPDGFPNAPDDRPPSESGLDITVESGARVENFVGASGGTNSIAILQENTLTIEPGGSVVARGGASAISEQAGATGRGNTVVNAGGIALGSGGKAIDLRDRATVTNTATGRIFVDGGLLGVPGTAIEAGNGALIENDGLVSVRGVDSVGIRALGVRSIVRSSGTIRVDGPNAVGVALGGAGVLENEGLLDASRSDGGAAVDATGAGAFVRNAGTLRGGSGSGSAVRFGSLGTRALVNTGTIEAPSGTAVAGGFGNEQVLNQGTIQGDVLLGSGDDEFAWGSGSSLVGSLDGGAGGLDTLRLLQSPNATDDTFALDAPNGFEQLVVGLPGDTGRWTLTGASDYPQGIFVDAGVAEIDGAATVADPVEVRGGELRLPGSTTLPDLVVSDGSARLPAGANLASPVAVSGPGALRFAGDAALQGDLSSDGGLLELPLDAAGSAGRIDVAGDADLGATSRLELVQPAGTDPTLTGTPVRVLTTSGGVTGRFDDIRVSGGVSPFFRGVAAYGPDPNDPLFVDVTLTAFDPVGASGNERSVFTHLNEGIARGPVSDAYQDLLDALQPLSDADTLAALDALHGAVYDAHTSTALATGVQHARRLAGRRLRCERLVSPHRRERPSLPPCGERGVTVWGDASGLFRDRDGNTGFDDWSSAGGGLAVGLDVELAGGWELSGAVGGSRSGLDLDDDGDGSYTSVDVGVGASWKHDAGTHLRGVVAYGHGWHTTHRDVSFPGYSKLALSDHDSDRVTVLAEAGYAFRLMPFEIEPVASLDYTWIAEDSIDESNGGGARLAIDSRTHHQLAGEAGFRASMTLVKYAWAGAWLEWADGVWRPELRARWRQVFTDYDRDLEARLRDAPAGTGTFQTDAEDAQWGGRVGGSVRFQPEGSRNTIELGYDAFVGDGTTSHTARAVVRIPF